MTEKKRYRVYMKSELWNKYEINPINSTYEYLGDTYAASPEQACNNIAYKLKIKKYDERYLPYGSVVISQMEAR